LARGAGFGADYCREARVSHRYREAASGDAEIATPEAFTLDIEDDGDIPTPPERP
jgi:hypothetical protein